MTSALSGGKGGGGELLLPGVTLRHRNWWCDMTTGLIVSWSFWFPPMMVWNRCRVVLASVGEVVDEGGEVVEGETTELGDKERRGV